MADYTIKQNILKLCLRRVFVLIGFLLLLGVLVGVIHYTAGLDVFVIPLETFGVEVDVESLVSNIFLSGGVIIFGSLVLLILFSVLNAKSQQLKIDGYGLEYGGDKIPFQNIVRVSGNNDGLFNTIFSSWVIELEISGMKLSKISLSYVDHGDKWIAYLQGQVQRVNMQRQARFQEEQKIEGIMKDF